MPVQINVVTNRNLQDLSLCESVTGTHVPNYGNDGSHAKSRYDSKIWYMTNLDGSIVFGMTTTDVDTLSQTFPISLVNTQTLAGGIKINMFLKQADGYGGIVGVGSEELPCIIPQSV